MDKKDFYTQDEAKDILIGKAGTPQRDNYESNLGRSSESTDLKNRKRKESYYLNRY